MELLRKRNLSLYKVVANITYHQCTVLRLPGYGIKEWLIHIVSCSELGSVHECYIKDISQTFKEIFTIGVLKIRTYPDPCVRLNPQTNLCNGLYIISERNVYHFVKQTLRYSFRWITTARRLDWMTPWVNSPINIEPVILPAKMLSNWFWW